MQTGGCVDPKYAVALTSEKSWADEWSFGIYGEETSPGFLGDFSRSPDESPGPLGVVLAKTFGEGRIVIVADQNMFADDFINYADNYRLWLNIMAWLLRNDALREPDPYVHRQSPRIELFEEYEAADFGRHGEEGHYHFLSLLNRYYWTFTNNRPTGEADLLVFASNDLQLSEGHLQVAVKHLRRQRNLLLLAADKDVLDNQQGIVRQVLAVLGQPIPAMVNSAERTRIEVAGCGSIDILGPQCASDSRVIPPPSVSPSEDEQRHNTRVLAAVAKALERQDGS